MRRARALAITEQLLPTLTDDVPALIGITGLARACRRHSCLRASRAASRVPGSDGVGSVCANATALTSVAAIHIALIIGIFLRNRWNGLMDHWRWG